MIKYDVRKRQLMDLVNEMKVNKLIKSPYFQRKTVWRAIHKRDFIETILKGYPFPEVFIAKGDIDIDKMESTSCVVDGQQRLTSIMEYINDKFEVLGKNYSDLGTLEKENFLKYEIAVIELDVKHDDPEIKEIFKRLNRTFYSLSNIEKLSSEYGSCEFMLVAKLLCKDLPIEKYNDDDYSVELNPNISSEFKEWAINTNVSRFNWLIIDSPFFTGYEISRQIHLNYTLNILATIDDGIFNRNLNKDILEQYSEDYPKKDIVTANLNKVGDYIFKMKLKKSSYWYNKSNMFSLIIVMYNNIDNIDTMNIKNIKNKLEVFEKNIPDDYKLAAKEGVNNKKERLLRNEYLEKCIIAAIS